MINAHFNTIDPTNANIPDRAVVLKVHSEEDRLPNGEHERAARAFLLSDGIASGIGKDLAFVDKIPQFINEIIEQKSWECLYVAKGVATPYYCRYTKGSDSENFQAFITAKRPNGLETSVEILDRVLQADLEVKRKFRAIIYESRQGERTDLVDETSRSDCGKLNNLSSRQQENIRAANRAAEAIPEIGKLLDRGLIAIDLAAKLGREIKDPDNLTAEEREYVDKRDLIGIRLRQYIHTNTIPEDEDKEPAYSRELNLYLKDLLGIKDRSKPIRTDDPKKAAEKLLTFYTGENLKVLINHLRQGLEILPEQKEDATHDVLSEIKTVRDVVKVSEAPEGENNSNIDSPKDKFDGKSENFKENESESNSNFPSAFRVEDANDGQKENSNNHRVVEAANAIDSSSNTNLSPLISTELAERLGVSPKSIYNVLNKRKDRFMQWTQKKDPNGIGWQQSDEKKGRSYLFIPIQNQSF